MRRQPPAVRLLHTAPLDAAANMALDDALLARARATGEVVLRVYSWRSPALSLGRHQRAAGAYDPARLDAEGVEAVRRPTGGRAVLHAREVTYSVTAPDGALAPAAAGVRAACARVNAALLAGLRALGVDARLAAPSARAPRPDGAACFAIPTSGELVLGEGAAARKLAGSAQWREGGALLQHGSILVDDDQPRVAALAAASATDVVPPPPAATLRRALGRAPAAGEVAAALFGAAALLVVDDDEDDAVVDVRRLDGCETAAVERAAAARRAHYADPAWTWRR